MDILKIIRDRQSARVPFDRERPGCGVDRNDIAITQEADRASNGCLRPDMADAEAARAARKPAVSNERHLVSRALPI